MAIIPSNTQFVGDTTGVPIQELRSDQINALSEAFTMQDIIDTVGTDTNTTYDLAATQDGINVDITLTGSDGSTDTVALAAGTNITLTESGGFIYIDAAGGLAGTQYVYVAANGTDTANAAELQAAYSTAQTMSPSASNRITIIAAPGNYNFSSNFVLSTQYINLVSLDGNRSITFNGTASISIPNFTTNIFVKGVAVLNSSFLVGDFNSNTIIENCSGSNGSFGGVGGFGQNNSTYIDCVGSNDCFSSNGTAGGTYINCVGGGSCFGAYGTASGTFIDCTGSDFSFGGNGQASGTFTNCKGDQGSFGAYGTASGTFRNCIGSGGSDQFGGFGNASGIFTNCTGSNTSFGGFNIASGTFNNCIGGSNAFGGFGTLTGKLYYCRLTAGAFETVSGAGRTVLCIDGSNNQNNQ